MVVHGHLTIIFAWGVTVVYIRDSLTVTSFSRREHFGNCQVAAGFSMSANVFKRAQMAKGQ